MKNGKLQCKDIPTKPILEFVRDHGGIGCVWFKVVPDGFTRSVRLAMPPDLPDNLILAKMSNMIRKGLLDGCPCGCRGDYELAEKGKMWLLHAFLTEGLTEADDEDV